MTPATKSAPVRHGRASTRATSDPHFFHKDGPVIHIMHHLTALRRHRRSLRGRVAALETETGVLGVTVTGLHAQVLKDSLTLGTTRVPGPRDPEPVYGPPAGHPEAESLPLGAEDDVMLAGWSLDLWPNDEYGQITADGEDGDLLPAMADVRSCGKCGWTGTGGSCWCPRRPS